jgi:hypothetical protein
MLRRSESNHQCRAKPEFPARPIPVMATYFHLAAVVCIVSVSYYLIRPPYSCDLGVADNRNFNDWYGLKSESFTNPFNFQKGEDIRDCGVVYWAAFPDAIQDPTIPGWVVFAERGAGKSVLRTCLPEIKEPSDRRDSTWNRIQFSSSSVQLFFENFLLATSDLDQASPGAARLSAAKDSPSLGVRLASHWKVDDFVDAILAIAVDQYLGVWIRTRNSERGEKTASLRELPANEKMVLTYIFCSHAPIGNIQGLIQFLEWMWTPSVVGQPSGFFSSLISSGPKNPSFQAKEYPKAVRNQIRPSFNAVRVLQANRKETESILLNVMFEAPGFEQPVDIFQTRFSFFQQYLVTSRSRDDAKADKRDCDASPTTLSCVDAVEELRIFVRIMKRVHQKILKIVIDGLDENYFFFQGTSMVVPNLLTFVKSALDRNIISIFLPGDLKIYYLFPNFVVQVPDITQSRGGVKMQAVTAIDYFTKTMPPEERHRFDKLPLFELSWPFERLFYGQADFTLDYIRRKNSENSRCVPLPSIRTLLGLDNPEHVTLLSNLRHPRDLNSFMQEMMLRLQDVSVSGSSDFCSGSWCMLWNLRCRYRLFGDCSLPFTVRKKDIEYVLSMMQRRSIH